MSNDKQQPTRPEAYPRPTEKDSQLQNQPEFIDEKPNEFQEQGVSNRPVKDEEGKTSNEAERG